MALRKVNAAELTKIVLSDARESEKDRADRAGRAPLRGAVGDEFEILEEMGKRGPCVAWLSFPGGGMLLVH